MITKDIICITCPQGCIIKVPDALAVHSGGRMLP